MREIDPAAFVSDTALLDAGAREQVRHAKADQLRVRVATGTIAGLLLAWAPFAFNHVATSQWGHDNLGADAGWGGIGVLVLAWPLAICCCIATAVRCCMLLGHGRNQALPWLGACVCAAIPLWMRWMIH